MHEGPYLKSKGKAVMQRELGFSLGDHCELCQENGSTSGAGLPCIYCLPCIYRYWSFIVICSGQCHCSITFQFTRYFYSQVINCIYDLMMLKGHIVLTG